MFKKKSHYAFPVGIAFLLLAAGLALGQNADKNSAGPTANDVRLKIVEPADGATIVGSTVRVTVANSLPRTTQESTGTANMPNPSFRVYLGNTLKGELKRDENVLTIENVSVGSQRLVVEALNSSGEVIDRKEIRFNTVAAGSTTASVVSTSEQKPTMETPPAAEVAAAPVTTAPEPNVAARTLPQTASAAPRVGLAGLALIIAGLAVSRRSSGRKGENRLAA